MKKKVLHIQLLPLLSGAQNVMLHLLQALPEEEYEIYIASKPGGALVEEVQKRGYIYLALSDFVHPISVKDVSVFVQLFLLCRKYRFDIVHTHSSKPGFLGRIAARLAGVPMVIHTGHGAPFHDLQSALKRRLYMELERFGAWFGDKLVFVNNSQREFYLKHNLLCSEKAVTIYNAVNPELLSKLETLSKKKKPVSEKVTIGSMLRFDNAKNVVMTVMGAIRICRMRQDVDFIFAGDGEQLELCRMMVNTNHLQDRIHLPGWQDDTVKQLAKFDAFLLYSDYEGLPLSIIEAMHAALPVIGSDISSIRELVSSDCGWLIPSHNLEMFVAELNKILDERDSYRVKGLKAKKRIKELCSYENFVKGYITVYEGHK